MTLPEALELIDYWREFPPEHEMLSLFARVYTTWRPNADKPMTAEEHRASLEARWKSGMLNPKQMFEALGGTVIRGPADLKNIPGIGPFPGL